MVGILSTMSIIASAVFTAGALVLLYKAWRFMTKFGRYRRYVSKGATTKMEKKLLKEYETSEKASKLPSDARSEFFKHSIKTIHRAFHGYMVAYVFSIIFLVFAVYYIVAFTHVLRLERVSDGKEVNPFRWWFIQPIISVVSACLAGSFLNHYVMDLGVVGFLSWLGAILLGVTILLPVNSAAFWLIYSVSGFLTLIALAFLWGRETWRSSRHVAVLYYLLVNALYYLMFLASYETEGWFTRVATDIVLPILDVVVLCVPVIVLMTDWFASKYGVPLLPRALYEAYGIGHWWNMHTSSELHYIWPSNVLMVVPDKNNHRHHHGNGSTKDGKETKAGGEPSNKLLSQCDLCGHCATYKQEYPKKKNDDISGPGERPDESEESDSDESSV